MVYQNIHVYLHQIINEGYLKLSQTMETAKRTKTTDIFEIASALDGKVDFSEIKFNQCILGEEHGKSVNDMLFVKQAYGVYFYTSKNAFESLISLTKKPLITLVGCKNSTNLYEIK